MKLGFGLITCQRHPGDPRSDADLYRDALEIAAEAEQLGFDSVWLSEHHFVDDGYMPSLLPVAAAIAARSQRLEIGTGVVLAPLHDPIRLAEDAATVDLISAGRLVLGLGLGWRAEEFEALGVSKERLGPRLREIVRILREAWSDGLVTAGGRDRGVSVTPKPARPGGPPIWIGGSAEGAVRRAGRIADGFLASRVSPETFAVQVEWLREELERSGRDPQEFSLATSTLVFAWHGRDAWERALPYLHYVRWKYVDMAGAWSRTGPPPEPPPLTAADERELRATALVGAPEEIAEQILAYKAVAGDRFHFSGRMYLPGMDPGVQRETMRIFAEDVAPLIR